MKSGHLSRNPWVRNEIVDWDAPAFKNLFIQVSCTSHVFIVRWKKCCRRRRPVSGLPQRGPRPPGRPPPADRQQCQLSTDAGGEEHGLQGSLGDGQTVEPGASRQLHLPLLSPVVLRLGQHRQGGWSTSTSGMLPTRCCWKRSRSTGWLEDAYQSIER